MLPASNDYTAELDDFEVVDSQTSKVYSTVHGTTNGTWGSDSQAFTVPDTSTGFHTYGVDWEPTTTTFYMDGKELGSAPTPSSMNSPMFMLLNLAVGGAGSWPGAPDSTTSFPASLQIDDVRAYATAGTTFVGGSAALPAQPSSPAAPADPSTPAAPPAPPPTTTIGSGPDVLALSIAADAYQGNAQFTVSVDGKQIGGTQTVTALESAGATQLFDVLGSFAAGQHTVSVDFLNDAFGGTATTDRNLYVTHATIDGTTIAGGSLSLMSSGTQSFAFQAPGSSGTGTGTARPLPPPPAADRTTIGSGPDVLALSVAEDAYQGDAQFTVSVDGKQIGGTQTATALESAGATQLFDVLGSFAAGQHTVSVDFLNDAFGGTATTDRNLYVTHATIDGTTVAGGSLSLMSSGSQSFAFQAPGPSNSGGGSTGGSGASGGSSGGNTSTSTGSGADTLTLGVSGMPGRETPQFTVSVDGQQVGGVRTATAQHSAGAINQMTISGNWGSGPHTLGISFINDAFGGTSATDRNLYVNSASYDGRQVPGTPTALMSNGTTNLAIPGASASTGGTLNLHLAEDAYQGDAQFTVAVDGKSLGAAQSVTALNANGRLADFSFADTLGAGSHDVAVSFINDLYGRTAATDRNLYVKGIDYNGTALPGATATLDSTGTPTSNLVVPTT